MHLLLPRPRNVTRNICSNIILPEVRLEAPASTNHAFQKVLRNSQSDLELLRTCLLNLNQTQTKKLITICDAALALWDIFFSALRGAKHISLLPSLSVCFYCANITIDVMVEASQRSTQWHKSKYPNTGSIFIMRFQEGILIEPLNQVLSFIMFSYLLLDSFQQFLLWSLLPKVVCQPWRCLLLRKNNTIARQWLNNAKVTSIAKCL